MLSRRWKVAIGKLTIAERCGIYTIPCFSPAVAIIDSKNASTEVSTGLPFPKRIQMEKLCRCGALPAGLGHLGRLGSP